MDAARIARGYWVRARDTWIDGAAGTPSLPCELGRQISEHRVSPAWNVLYLAAVLLLLTVLLLFERNLGLLATGYTRLKLGILLVLMALSGLTIRRVISNRRTRILLFEGGMIERRADVPRLVVPWAEVESVHTTVRVSAAGIRQQATDDARVCTRDGRSLRIPAGRTHAGTELVEKVIEAVVADHVTRKLQQLRHGETLRFGRLHLNASSFEVKGVTKAVPWVALANAHVAREESWLAVRTVERFVIGRSGWWHGHRVDPRRGDDRHPHRRLADLQDSRARRPAVQGAEAQRLTAAR